MQYGEDMDVYLESMTSSNLYKDLGSTIWKIGK